MMNSMRLLLLVGLSLLAVVAQAEGKNLGYDVERDVVGQDGEDALVLSKENLSSRKQGDGRKSDLVIVYSNVGSDSKPEMSLSEGEVMEEVLKALDVSTSGYIASYVTDLPREDLDLSRRRQLGTKLRVSNESFCDAVCQTKATILEGLFVAITLLIILISGICCMAGITTPSRFEQAKES